MGGGGGGFFDRGIGRLAAAVTTFGASEAVKMNEDIRSGKRKAKAAQGQAIAEQQKFEKEQADEKATAEARDAAQRMRDSRAKRQRSARAGNSGRAGTLLGGAGGADDRAGEKTLLGS